MTYGFTQERVIASLYDISLVLTNFFLYITLSSVPNLEVYSERTRGCQPQVSTLLPRFLCYPWVFIYASFIL